MASRKEEIRKEIKKKNDNTTPLRCPYPNDKVLINRNTKKGYFNSRFEGIVDKYKKKNKLNELPINPMK